MSATRVTTQRSYTSTTASTGTTPTSTTAATITSQKNRSPFVVAPPLPSRDSSTQRYHNSPRTTTTGSMMINSRRLPPPTLPALRTGAPAGFRIERLQVNGEEREVLTIEDTPEPSDVATTSSSVTTSNARGLNTNGRNGAPVTVNGAQANHASNSEAGRHYYPASTTNNNAPTSNGISSGSVNKRRKNNDHSAASSNGIGIASGSSAVANAGSSANRAHGAAHQMLPPNGSAANSRFATQYSSASKKRKADELETTCDKDGHFIIVPGSQIVDSRNRVTYTIDRSLGQGTFGKVVAAKSSANNKMVAVKVIRAVPKYKEAAKVEISVLHALAFSDPDNRYQCIHMLSSFDYRDHTCIVSDLLSVSVFDFLKDNGYAPFPFAHVQSFAYQLLRSVKYVHREKYIHTDLKPENILLEDRTAKTIDNPLNPKHKARRILKTPRIRLIDFGSATKDTEYHATVVSTRHYRAPEIILGLNWSFPCDIWSIGCILVEFVTGEALFQTHENLEHLAMMEKVFGKIPSRLAVNAIDKARTDASNPKERNKAPTDVLNWFNEQPRGSYKVNFPLATTVKQSKKFVDSMKTLERIVTDACSNAYDDAATNKKPLQEFIKLLRLLLKWDPAERISVAQALEHDFFKTEIKDDVLRAWPDWVKR